MCACVSELNCGVSSWQGMLLALLAGAKKCETLIRYKAERCHTNTHQHTQQAISLCSSWSVAGGLIRPVSGFMQIIRLSFLSGRGNLIMHVYTQVQNSNNKQSNKAWHEMCIKEPSYKARPLFTSLPPSSALI